MRKVQGDSVLWRRDDLPDAVLVDGVKVGEGWGGDGPVWLVDPPPTRIWGGKMG